MKRHKIFSALAIGSWIMTGGLFLIGAGLVGLGIVFAKDRVHPDSLIKASALVPAMGALALIGSAGFALAARWLWERRKSSGR